MVKLIIVTLAFFVGLFNKHIPKDITGKWVVENVDTSRLPANLPSEQKNMMNEKLIKPLSNAVFDFEPDHHFYLSAKLGNMPRNTKWEYDETNGVIKIEEYHNSKSLIMQINVFEKDSGIFFDLHEIPIALKMHKK